MTTTHHDNDNDEAVRRLEEGRPAPLSPSARQALWLRIEPALIGLRPVPSPFMFLGMHSRALAAGVVALVMVVSLGGTALASESARPGDFLYPVDRALEDTRLLIALSDDARGGLINAFTEERLRELHDIVEEEKMYNQASGTTLSDDGQRRVERAISDVSRFLEGAGVDSAPVLRNFVEESRSNRDDDEGDKQREDQSELEHEEDEDEEQSEHRGSDVRGGSLIEDDGSDTDDEPEDSDRRDNRDDDEGDKEDEEGRDSDDSSSDDDDNEDDQSSVRDDDRDKTDDEDTSSDDRGDRDDESDDEEDKEHDEGDEKEEDTEDEEGEE